MKTVDKETARKLMAISKGVFAKYKHQLIKREKPFEMEKIGAMEAVLDPKTPPEMREVLQKAIDTGAYDRETEIVNERIAEKIDKEIKKEVDKAIKSGAIKKPKLDKWAKKQFNLSKQAWKKRGGK